MRMFVVLAESIQLVPDGTLLIHLGVVGVMVFVLNRTLLKPINRILSERERQIRQGISEAQTLSEAREDKIQQYTAALREARSEGYRLLEKERAQALIEKETRVRSFKDEIGKRVALEVQATHIQQEQVRKELEAQATGLGAEISTQIFRSTPRDS
jgi:F0F1-type ATP synthase membrane subunit b/b'